MTYLKSPNPGKLVRILCIALLTLPASAKTVTVEIDPDGQTSSTPANVNAGDSIVFHSGDSTLTYASMTMSSLSQVGATSPSCGAKSTQDTKAPVAIVFSVCKGGSVIRVGILVLGPHRKAFYLAYSPSSDPQNPYQLTPIGDLPVLTTDDEPVLVIVNKLSSDSPSHFDLSFSQKAGTFIDVAPVRPTTSQSNAKSVQSKSPATVQTACYRDELLLFQKKFSGEQIVDYIISAQSSVQTSNKTAVTTDSKDSSANDTKTEIDSETASHTIFSGELPQIHSLYYYNITTGIIVTGLRNPTYARILTQIKDSSHDAQYRTEQQPGSDRAMPVVMFSAYLKPMDAQVPWHPADLIPAPSIGFSLTSPADDFFFGLSHEIRRHVQIVYGYHLGKINTLPPTQGLDDPSDATAPVTSTRFKGNVFAGVTFNIDFLKGIFKGQ